MKKDCLQTAFFRWLGRKFLYFAGIFCLGEREIGLKNICFFTKKNTHLVFWDELWCNGYRAAEPDIINPRRNENEADYDYRH